LASLQLDAPQPSAFQVRIVRWRQGRGVSKLRIGGAPHAAVVADASGILPGFAAGGARAGHEQKKQGRASLFQLPAWGWGHSRSSWAKAAYDNSSDDSPAALDTSTGSIFCFQIFLLWSSFCLAGILGAAACAAPRPCVRRETFAAKTGLPRSPAIGVARHGIRPWPVSSNWGRALLFTFCGDALWVLIETSALVFCSAVSGTGFQRC